MTLSQNFLHWMQAHQKVNHYCSKKTRKGEEGEAQKKLNNDKPKDIVHFLKLLSNFLLKPEHECRKMWC